MPADPHLLLNLLETGFPQLRILVVGDIMLDRYIVGEVERISPEAPVPVLRHAQRYERPGGAANVAMNLAGLGCEAILAGFWGGDAEQAELAGLLETAGIDTVGVVLSALPTISKTRIVARTQQMLRLDIESRERYPAEDLGRLEARAVELAGKVHAVVLSDYNKGALTPQICERVIRAARGAGVPVLVDPKTRDFSKYSGATTVCPNLSELAQATGVAAHQTAELLAAARAQMLEHEIGFMTVTMSEKGITVLKPEGEYHSPARAREVFDVSGAGDTVIATLAACLAGKLPVEPAVELANLAAGIVVGKVGTVPIAQHELVAALTPSTGVSAEDKLLSRDRILRRVAEWRAGGETVVFTHGRFNRLDVAHIALLEACRRFGSKVVVGLNSDASAQRRDEAPQDESGRQGLELPAVCEGDRARVVAALAAVDAVVLFDEDTPLELMHALQPNVLAAVSQPGGPRLQEDVAGYAEVIAWGGRVQLVPGLDEPRAAVRSGHFSGHTGGGTAGEETYDGR